MRPELARWTTIALDTLGASVGCGGTGVDVGSGTGVVVGSGTGVKVDRAPARVALTAGVDVAGASNTVVDVGDGTRVVGAGDGSDDGSLESEQARPSAAATKNAARLSVALLRADITMPLHYSNNRAYVE
jgi:hypothetical protein